MKRTLTIAFALLAFPLGVGIAAAASSNQGPPHPGCKPSHDTPPKCHTTPTVTEPGTTTTVTQTETVTTPAVTVTTPVVPPVTVTPGPTNTTVTITITINGVPQSVTVPGQLPAKPCVNTRRTALLGPLPFRFHQGLRVSVAVNGNRQLRTVQAGRKVSVNLPAACGPVAFVVNDVPNTRAIRPVLRIWLLEGGNRIVRVGSPLPVPPIGLS